jgi:hypothetical protein
MVRYLAQAKPNQRRAVSKTYSNSISTKVSFWKKPGDTKAYVSKSIYVNYFRENLYVAKLGTEIELERITEKYAVKNATSNLLCTKH